MNKLLTTLASGVMAVSASMASVSSHAAVQCTDFDSVNNAPYFHAPDKQGFRFFWNKWLSEDIPFHMGHDTIIGEGQTATVTGKFDYGAVAHKDLEYEYVKAYVYGSGMDDWQYVGRYKTNSDGKIFVEVDDLTEGHYQVKMVVVGDLSEANSYITVVKQGAKAVVFDIDETLTTDDLEQILDYTGIEAADARGGAAELVNSYVAKGYHPLFVTARTYWYAKGSRHWLSDHLGVPEATLRTTLSNETGLFKTAEYKTAVLQEVQEAGMEIVRAYGNATTDIEGFANAGVPLSEIYVVGDKAGEMGSQPIEGGEYWSHLSEVVEDTPHSGCSQ
ncbi:LNS2 domain-containing protein [Litoribacillus peritrichatus]|uniref:LNS2/PITP domain-containing protein n=1 Tax=Litoribacillus peritrichatus TaxID=718191 RepID=A0ABP7MSR9_9GAMM